MAEPFMGQIMQVGFNFAPRGWQICAGQIIGIAQNSAMFSLLGTTFGGNGTQTFGLPDCRSRVMVGVGQAPGLSNYVWGEITGTEQVTLLTPNMPAHTHAAMFTGNSSPVTVNGSLQALTSATNQQAAPAAGSQLANITDPSGGTPQIYAPAGTSGTAVNLGGLNLSGGSVTPAGTIQVGVTGNNVPVSVLQPLISVYTIIAMEGIFPSRS